MFYFMALVYIVLGVGTVWLHSDLYKNGGLYNELDLVNLYYEDYDIKVYDKKHNLYLEEENMI